MKKIIAKMHIPLLVLTLIYSILGLIMIFSASSVAAVLRYGYDSNHFFIRQLLWLIMGYACGFIVLFFPTKFYRYGSKLGMFGMIMLLVLVFFVGKIVGGAKSWYDLGGMNFQPTEFAKLILIVYMAVYYHRISVKKQLSLYNLLWPVIVAVVLFFLIAVQPDFGGAFIIFVITLLVFFSLPMGKKHKKNIGALCIIAVILGAATLFLFGDSLLKSYQVRRIVEFTKPCQRYGEDSGYQVCNGYIAIHNGGLLGVGLGESTQKYLYLPESHTDFIFPIICEELGAIVGIVVVLGYILILLLILKVAKNSYNLRNSILCYGIFSYMLAHILINLLGVLGLIPLTGVPLPLLSYGGSYNLTLIVSLFIVQRVHIENKIEKNKRLIENL